MFLQRIRSSLIKSCAVRSTELCSKRYYGEDRRAVSGSSGFSVVYKLPQISVCSMINKLKKYQLLSAGVGTPIALGLNVFEMCDQSLLTAFTGIGVASTVALFSVGQLFTNMIGVVYISKDKRQVRISYLDFWGGRQDKVVPTEDVIGLTAEPLKPWSRLRVASDGRNYKVNLRFGEIRTTPLFKLVFKYDPDESR